MSFLKIMSGALTVIWILLLVCCGSFFTHVDSISCYRCDALDSKESDCPGWNRKPISSIIDLKDRGGLYTHCVDVRLANGTVLHQDVVPMLPTCKASFIQTWHDTLVKRYQMEVSIICCEWSRCNGPNAGASTPSSGQALVLALPVLVSVMSYFSSSSSSLSTCWTCSSGSSSSSSPSSSTSSPSSSRSDTRNRCKDDLNDAAFGHQGPLGSRRPSGGDRCPVFPGPGGQCQRWAAPI